MSFRIGRQGMHIPAYHDVSDQLRPASLTVQPHAMCELGLPLFIVASKAVDVPGVPTRHTGVETQACVPGQPAPATLNVQLFAILILRY